MAKFILSVRSMRRRRKAALTTTCKRCGPTHIIPVLAVLQAMGALGK